MLTKGQPKQVMALSCEGRDSLFIRFQDGRMADLSCYGDGDFGMLVKTREDVRYLSVSSPYFKAFTTALLDFFQTGISPVPMEETLQIMALQEAGLQAFKHLGTWTAVPGG